MARTRIRNTQIVNDTILGSNTRDEIGIYDEMKPYNSLTKVLWNGEIYRVILGHSVTGHSEGDLSFNPIIDTVNWERFLDTKLDKHLTYKKIWQGDINNVPQEIDYPYQATIGVGGEYATLAAAIADNKYILLLVGNTTENANTVINYDGNKLTTIKIDSTDKYNIIQFGTYNIVNNTECDITFNHLTITWRENSGLLESISADSYTYMIFNYCNITNLSTTVHNMLLYWGTNSKSKIYINNSGIGLGPGVANGLSSQYTYCDNIYINDSTISGYNTGYDAGTMVVMSNCVVQGSFATNIDSTTFSGIYIGVYVQASNVHFGIIFNKLKLATSIEFKLGYINNMVMSNTENNIYDNIVNVNELIINRFDKTYIVSNCVTDHINLPTNTTKSTILTNVIVNNEQILNRYPFNATNCIFKSNVTISANNITLTDTYIGGNLTISGDNVRLNNCFLPNGTITINATANKTQLTNSRTLTSIVDNGTLSTLMNNELI